MRDRAAALAALLGLATMVAMRLTSSPMDGYGDSAAQYIEHLARLRLQLRIAQGIGPDPLSALVQLDGLYPPGLHLLTAAVAPLIGHTAEAVAWTGLLWWAGLALATARAAEALRPGAGPWAMVATAAIPALHASATRYYYDLPMTALLWAALATLLHAERGRPLARGAAAGMLFSVACLVKWSALPFGLPLVAGALTHLWLRNRHAAARVGLATLLVAGGMIGGFIASGSTSFGAMTSSTFQPPPGVEPAALASIGQMPGGTTLRAMVLQAATIDTARLSFYPTRLIATVLSPTLAVAGLPLLFAWLRDRAPGWPILVVGGATTFAFILLLVPPLDERFLLTLAPAFGLSAGLGGAALPGRPRSIAAILGMLASLAVAADFHLRPTTVPLHDQAGQLRDDALDGRRLVLRPGAGSSWDLRGWARSDTARRDRTRLRRALDRRLSSCASADLEARDPGVLTAAGDDNWFAYREALAAVEGRPAGPQWPTDTPAPVSARIRADPPGALGADTAPLPPHQWTVDDPDGGPGVRIASAQPGLCPES
ncbi:MAG: hypothetical protein VX000_17125 [Myxococcota bacterium]|nr:hypothetical protein [Myxococcota bacterium]